MTTPRRAATRRGTAGGEGVEGLSQALSVDSGARRSKYGVRLDPAGKAARTVNGIVFDSAAEARRYQALVFALYAGEITDLELQPSYDLTVGGVRVAGYRGDFRYRRDGVVVVEDVKSQPTKTAVYRLKRKLMLAIHGIAIREITE